MIGNASTPDLDTGWVDWYAGLPAPERLLRAAADGRKHPADQQHEPAADRRSRSSTRRSPSCASEELGPEAGSRIRRARQGVHGTGAVGALREPDASRRSSPDEINLDKVIYNPIVRARPDQLPVQVGRRTWRSNVEAATAAAEPPPAPPAAAPGTWPGGGCGATASRSASSALFVLDRRLRPRGAALGRQRRPHRPERDPHARDRSNVDGETREVVNPDGKPIGPLWFEAGRQVLPRRRRPARPRRDGAAHVRRPHLAPDRPRRGADHDPPRDRPRPARRLLPRLGRRRDLAAAGRDLGLPGAAARRSPSASRWRSAA